MVKVQTLKTFAAVLICACGIVGCSREEAKEPAANASSPESVMDDPVFMAKVDAQDRAQRLVMKKYAETKRAYEAAKVSAPEAEATKKLLAEMENLKKEFEACQEKMRQIVGSKMRAHAKESQKK